MVRKAFRNALMIQIIAGIVGVLGMVVDGAVTGSCLGTEAMAGFGLATPVVTIFVACSGVCELGTSMLIGRLVGGRKPEETSEALSSCLAFAFGFSLLLTVCVFAFSEQIASFLGASGTVAGMTSDYLRGFSLCTPALFLLTALMPVMQIEGRMKLVVLSVISMTAVNITGDLLVGFVFRGGLFGMALATTVSYFTALVILLPALFGKGNPFSLSFRHIRPAYIRAMLSGGLPNALQQGCRSLLLLLLNRRLLAIADANAVAAFTAIMSAGNLCMALGSGIGSDVSMLTGVFAGERDDKAIRELVRTALFTAAVYDAILCAVLLLAAGILMPLFTSDPILLDLAITGFRLYCLSMIAYSVNVTLRLYYQAMHFSKLSYIYVFCNSFLFTVLGAFLLSEMLGVNGIWLSFLFGETLTLVLLAVWTLIRTEKQGSLIDRALFIPPEMTADVLNRFDASAENPAVLAEVSEQLRLFCLEHGSGERAAFALALSAEEVGNVLLRKNAGRGERVEVRVLRKKGGWNMIVRDNGKHLNPLDILRDSGSSRLAEILQEAPADAISFVGIKLICEMARKTEYLDTLNINSLNIEI